MTQVNTNLLDSPAEIIRQLMIQSPGAAVVDGAGYGAASAPLTGVWPIYKSVQPDPTYNQITVKLTQGVDAGRSMYDGEMLSHFAFQLRVRAVDDEVGITKLWAIRSWMESGVYYQQVSVFNKDADATTLYLVPCLSGIGQALELGRDRPSSAMWNGTLNFFSPIRYIVGQ
jgi:hypothetical protein